MIIRLRNQDKIAIHNSYEAHRVIQHVIDRDKEINLTKEHFWTIALDIKKIIVNIELLGIGSSYSVLVPLKDIFYIPHQKKASSLILIHNHPGGSLRPSDRDIDLTDNVIQIGRIVKINVVDHLILGGYRGKTNRYYSFNDQHIMEKLEFSTKYLLKDEAEEIYRKQITKLNNLIELQQENKKLIFNEGILVGKEKGKLERNVEIAKTMLKEGDSVDKILRVTGLYKSDIQDII